MSRQRFHYNSDFPDFGRSSNSLIPSFMGSLGNGLIDDDIFMGSNFGGGMTSGSTMMSFSSYSSSSSSNGPPTIIKKSFVETRSSGGIAERKESFYDSRSGVEGASVSRKIGDRGRTIAKVRDSSGTERSVDTLHNMNDNECDAFDQDWNHITSGGRYIQSHRHGRNETDHPQLLLTDSYRDVADIAAPDFSGRNDHARYRSHRPRSAPRGGRGR